MSCFARLDSSPLSAISAPLYSAKAGVIGCWPFCFAATAVQAAPVDVYRGPLGGAEVVLELRKPDADGELQGRYFYLRHGVDIPLKGRSMRWLKPCRLMTGGAARSQSCQSLRMSKSAA